MTWQNRITGTGTEAPDQLLANPNNFRIHTEFQQQALKGILDEVGFIQNVIVNQRSGHLIDGHLRVTLAMREGQAEIPVVYVDLDENEERLALAAIDPVGALAATDNEKLIELLQETTINSDALQEMFADMIDIDGYCGADDCSRCHPGNFDARGNYIDEDYEGVCNEK